MKQFVEGRLYYFTDRYSYNNIYGIVEVQYIGNGRFTVKQIIKKPNKKYYNTFRDEDINPYNLFDPLDPKKQTEIQDIIKIILGEAVK
jgi:hypothetical protein